MLYIYNNPKVPKLNHLIIKLFSDGFCARWTHLCVGAKRDCKIGDLF